MRDAFVPTWRAAGANKSNGIICLDNEGGAASVLRKSMPDVASRARPSSAIVLNALLQLEIILVLRCDTRYP